MALKVNKAMLLSRGVDLLNIFILSLNFTFATVFPRFFAVCEPGKPGIIGNRTEKPGGYAIMANETSHTDDCTPESTRTGTTARRPHDER
jgi:hypothetical protein